jgi:hypothetical protein
VSGTATYAGCKIAAAGTGYTLTATAAGYPSVVSDPFDVAIGPASNLVFLQQPSSVVAGQVWSPAVQVALRDAGGNVVVGAGVVDVRDKRRPRDVVGDLDGERVEWGGVVRRLVG